MTALTNTTVARCVRLPESCVKDSTNATKECLVVVTDVRILWKADPMSDCAVQDCGRPRYGRGYYGRRRECMNLRDFIDNTRATTTLTPPRNKWGEHEMSIALDMRYTAHEAARRIGCHAETVKRERQQWVFE